MPWFKVDDKFHDHSKRRRADLAAVGLWAVAGSWCADNLTDGFVPEDVCARWNKHYRKLAAVLCDVGLWHPTTRDGEPGWQFHDWAQFQPSATAVRKERAAAAERQRRAREAAKAKREAAREAASRSESRRDIDDSHGVTSAVSHAASHGPPSHGPPDPTRPDPTRPSTKPPAGTAAPSSANPATAQTLIGEWVDSLDVRPPSRVIGQLSREVKQLLDDGQPVDDVRHAVAAWQAKGLNPSTLASVLHEQRARRTPPGYVGGIDPNNAATWGAP